MEYLLGVDFGGSSCKTTLLAENGEVTAVASKEYETFSPHVGWTEQNPDDAYEALVATVREILEKTAVCPENIRAMAVDAATHTSVLLDAKDRVIRPAIFWTDKRSSKQAAYLKENYFDKIYSLVYNQPSPTWTMPQVMWVRDNEKENFDRISRILFLKDYVRYRLTGDFVTDHIEAIGSMWMDVPNKRWSEELCTIGSISPKMLPEIVEPTKILSPLRREFCEQTGLSRKTKVIAGAPDTALELYANGAIRPGQMTVKLATAGRICPVTTEHLDNPLFFNYRHVIPGTWYPGTGTKSCAASFRWYRDTLGMDEKQQASQLGTSAYAMMSEAAAQIPIGSEHLYFHPYLQGENTPYFDTSLRASFVGATSHHTKAHFTRALLEGVAFSLKDCFAEIKRMQLSIQSARIIGGGAASPLWRQIVADMLNIPLTKNENSDSSLGSAMLAGVASGVFASYEESVEKCVREESVVEPIPENVEQYDEHFGIYKEIQAVLAPVYHKMH